MKHTTLITKELGKTSRMGEGAAGYKGVVIRARICFQGRIIYLGSFATTEEAARAYDEAAERLIGDRAITNKSLGLLP